MKILHLNSYYATTPLYTQLYDRQVRDQLDIDVYVPIKKNFSDNQLPNFGSYVTSKKVFGTLHRAILPYKIYTIWKDLIHTYDVNQYDLVHAHSLFSNGTLAHKIWKKIGTPYIVAIRSADVQTFFEKLPFYRHWGIQVLKNASQIIFISNAYYERVFNQYIPKKYIEDFKKKSIIIGNGINDQWINQRISNPKDNPTDPIQVVSVGKLLPGKQHLLLAKLLKNYSKDYRPTHLHVIGQRWDESIYSQLMQEKNVTYHDAMNIEQLITFYKQMNVFALLSSRETFGLVYPEAMSQGLPVIYTNGEGFDGFFDDKFVGVSTDYRDQKQFNFALNYILDHYQELSTNAIQQLHHFNWDEIVKQYNDLYYKILEEGAQ